MSDVYGFTRRRNRDHTLDSICNVCHKIVATGLTLMDLILPEIAHRCVPATVPALPIAKLTTPHWVTSWNDHWHG